MGCRCDCVDQLGSLYLFAVCPQKRSVRRREYIFLILLLLLLYARVFISYGVNNVCCPLLYVCREGKLCKL